MSKFRVTLEPERLVQLAQTQICQNLWTHSQIKRSMILGLQKQEETLQNDKTVFLGTLKPIRENQLLNQVSHNIDQLRLPTDMKDNLKIFAKKMSFMIFEYLHSVSTGDNILIGKGNYADLENFLNHIKWTPDGEIDSSETLRSMFYAKLLPDDNHTWLKLTSYCLEDCIVDCFERIKPGNYTSPQLLRQSCILPIYWNRRLQDDLNEFSIQIKPLFSKCEWFDESDSLELNFLRAFLEYENHPAARYFWNSLNDDQRIKIIYKLIEERGNISVQTAVVLLKHALDYGIHAFITVILAWEEIIQRLITWPYESMFLRILGESWPQIDDADLEKMAQAICVSIVGHRFSGAPAEAYDKYIDIFMEIWRRIGDDHKSSMNCGNYVFCFKNNIKMLKCIFNDPALRTKRDELIQSAQSLPDEMQDEFCEVVLESDEERQKLRRIIQELNDAHEEICTLVANVNLSPDEIEKLRVLAAVLQETDSDI